MDIWAKHSLSWASIISDTIGMPYSNTVRTSLCEPPPPPPPPIPPTPEVQPFDDRLVSPLGDSVGELVFDSEFRCSFGDFSCSNCVESKPEAACDYGIVSEISPEALVLNIDGKGFVR